MNGLHKNYLCIIDKVVGLGPFSCFNSLLLFNFFFKYVKFILIPVDMILINNRIIFFLIFKSISNFSCCNYYYLFPFILKKTSSAYFIFCYFTFLRLNILSINYLSKCFLKKNIKVNYFSKYNFINVNIFLDFFLNIN